MMMPTLRYFTFVLVNGQSLRNNATSCGSNELDARNHLRQLWSDMVTDPEMQIRDIIHQANGKI